MAERSNNVGDIKGSYRSEAVVSQQNAAAISSKRSRISKKADSVSSACGTSRKWADQYPDGTVREPRSETVLGGSNTSSMINPINANADSHENDHDYGLLPGRNGHQQEESTASGPRYSLGVTNGNADKDEDGPNQTEVVEFDENEKQITGHSNIETTNGVEDGINRQKGIQGHKTMNSASSDVSEMRSEQVEPTPDSRELQKEVISFLDSLLANKKNMQQKAAAPVNLVDNGGLIKSEYDISGATSQINSDGTHVNCNEQAPVYWSTGVHSNDLVDVKKEMATMVNVPQGKTAATINGGEHGSSISTLAGPGISNLSVIKTANGINLNGQLGSHLGIPKQLAQVSRTGPLVLPIANGISSTTISGIRTISHGSIGNNGNTGPNVIVVNSNQLRTLFPNASTLSSSSSIARGTENATGSAQVIQIRQSNGVHVQNSINDVNQKRSIQARFIDGEYSQSLEQTDLKINDVVGLELYLEGGNEGGRGNRDISHPQLYGTVNIYLVHSHDLFLRDTIDAKGHQGVKGDTDVMKDYPLRAWVLNGSQEYKIKQTKVHGDSRAVSVTLQGENKVHLLFTVLSTDQRNFGRNHKAKLWSLEITGELNSFPVKISLPVQVVACLRNPLRLKRSKRRADSTNHRPHLKQIKTEAKSPVPDEQSDINNLSGSSSVSNGIVNMRSTFDESLVQNGSSTEMANDSTAFVRTINNGHQGVGVSAVSSNVAVTSLEKSVLIEELIQTLRETYDRMPAHLLQYELAKAKALSVLKFT